ncbi:MAG: DUF2807 domain-containing protein [Parasphingorhabdus sp.]
MRHFILILTTVFLAIAGTAEAKERKLSGYSFDAIQIIGNVNVSIETGKGPSAVAEADTRLALDRVSVRKAGNELIVSVRPRPTQTDRFSSEPPIALRLTTYQLTKILHRGSGSVAVDNMKERNTNIRVGGFGSVTVGNIETVRLEISMNGGGELTIGGAARTAKVDLLGSSRLDATAFTVDDLNLTHRGPANTQIAVDKRAEITNGGSGFIQIYGRPKCLVRTAGAAEIICNPKN